MKANGISHAGLSLHDPDETSRFFPEGPDRQQSGREGSNRNSAVTPGVSPPTAAGLNVLAEQVAVHPAVTIELMP